MKDKNPKFEENETSLTVVGGTGEGRVEVRGRWRGCRLFFTVRYSTVNRSRRSHHMDDDSVTKKTYVLVYRCEWGTWGTFQTRLYVTT
jgi:hypothetical protein